MERIAALLNAANARYLVIGGQAIRLHGLPRYSMDWDLYLPARDEDNFRKINEALESLLDFPAVPLGPRGENFVQTYPTENGILQFHLAGPGFPPFSEAEQRAVTVLAKSGIPIRCISPADLLRMKEVSGRAKDEEDIKFLRALLANG